MAIGGMSPTLWQLREGVREETDFKEVLHVIPQGLHHEVQQVPRVVHEEHRNQQEIAHDKGGLGEAFHASADTGYHRKGSNTCNYHDNDGGGSSSLIGVHVMCQPPKSPHARHGLLRAQAQGGAEPRDDRHDGHHVDEVPEPPPRGPAEERRQGAPEAQRQALAVGDQPHADGRHGVHDPGLQPPVEDRDVHGVLHHLVLVRVAVGVVAVGAPLPEIVPERLRRAVEDEADGHARAEDHGEVAEVRELRPLVVPAEPHVAVVVDQRDQPEEPDVLRADVEPGEVPGHPRLPLREARLGAVGVHQAPDDKAPERQAAHNGDDGVEVEAAAEPHLADAKGAAAVAPLVLLLVLPLQVVLLHLRHGRQHGWGGGSRASAPPWSQT
mmetsp:Transcript_73384/g.194971  ORF Transcript_73384/g.194971 Transcript_73384/m.194971 type:complete len:382 (+) Transcript_73384:807-1952(+)